jgi:hypothetical protein
VVPAVPMHLIALNRWNTYRQNAVTYFIRLATAGYTLSSDEEPCTTNRAPRSYVKRK